VKIQIIKPLMFIAAVGSFSLSIYSIHNNHYLSIMLLSSSVFFIFLYLNPKILMAKKVGDIDQIIPTLKGKTFMVGSFVLLIIGFLML